MVTHPFQTFFIDPWVSIWINDWNDIILQKANQNRVVKYHFNNKIIIPLDIEST